MAQKTRGIPWEDFKTANSILDRLESEGPLSRATVAKKLGLSRTTLTNVVSPLIGMGLVAEREEQADPQGRGRPGIPLDLETSRWFALGAAFHSARWVFAITNLKGEVVFTKSVNCSAGDPKNFLAALAKGLRAMMDKSPGPLLPGVGIGAPGLVNWETGTIIRADDMGWECIAVGDAVRTTTGFTAYVVNRNRAAGLAEARYGRGRNVSNFVYIGIGTGISAAVMLDGDLLHGASYSAGEIGHMVIDPKGPLCGCGNRGCLQTLAAEGALVATARRLFDSGKLPVNAGLGAMFRSGTEVRGGDVLRLAARGEKSALGCVKSVARYLGMATGSLITALNPEKIIFGGPLVRDGGEILVECVRKEAEPWTMAHPFSSAAIEISNLDEFAGARGAACLVLRDKLKLSGGE